VAALTLHAMDCMDSTTAPTSHPPDDYKIWPEQTNIARDLPVDQEEVRGTSYRSYATTNGEPRDPHRRSASTRRATRAYRTRTATSRRVAGQTSTTGPSSAEKGLASIPTTSATQIGRAASAHDGRHVSRTASPDRECTVCHTCRSVRARELGRSAVTDETATSRQGNTRRFSATMSSPASARTHAPRHGLPLTPP